MRRSSVLLLLLLGAGGTPLARYERACAHSRAGRIEKAAALLQAIRDDDCQDCRLILQLVPSDPMCDWRASRLRRLGEGVPEPPVHRAGREVARALASGDAAALAPFLGDGRVAYTDICSVCNPGDDVTRQRWRRRDVVAWVRALDARDPDKDQFPLVTGERMLCQGKCCEFPRDTIQHSHDYLDRLCFTSAEDPKLSSIETTNGG